MVTPRIKQSGFIWSIHEAVPYQDTNMITEIVIEDEYGLRDLSEIMPTPKTILDIGGHIGTFGLLAKSLWPKANLIAVEPDPENCRLYRINLMDNGFDGEVVQAAVGYRKDCNWLVSSPRSTGGRCVRTRNDAESWGRSDLFRLQDRMMSVNLVTIEDLTNKLDVIDLVKMDCEGSEWDIFENITDECAGKFRFILGESHVRKSYFDVPFREWNDRVFWRETIWRKIRRKFPHLNFNYELRRRGYFQAWPK